ncbi:MAG TPA: AraC family transcriptional regulator [Ruminiclostridium sp.]
MEVIDEYIELEGTYLLQFTNYHLNQSDATHKFNYHNELELSYVKSGSGIYTVDNKEYDICKGDIFIFNNIESHTITSINSGERLTNTVIIFDPRFIWSFENNLFDRRYLDIFFKRNDQFENRINRSNKATEHLRNLFVEIEEEFIHKLPEYQLMIKVKLLNMLVILTRYYGYIKSGEADNAAKRQNDLILINKAIEYIDGHLSEDIKLNDLATLAHMNASYFSTFFKKYIGVSPLEYLIKKRIHRAVEYIGSSTKTILEIANLCGFSNTANFNKTFRKLVGKVPSDLR